MPGDWKFSKIIKEYNGEIIVLYKALRKQSVEEERNATKCCYFADVLLKLNLYPKDV